MNEFTLKVADGYGLPVTVKQNCKNIEFSKGKLTLTVNINDNQWLRLDNEAITAKMKLANTAFNIFRGVLLNQRFEIHDIPRFILSIGVEGNLKWATSFCVSHNLHGDTFLDVLRAPTP